MSELMVGLYVFVLATLTGREVITKVPPTLHTPLMSGSNAISGISIVGALVSDVDRRTALARAGRNRVESAFDEERMIAETVEHLREVMQ